MFECNPSINSSYVISNHTTLGYSPLTYQFNMIVCYKIQISFLYSTIIIYVLARVITKDITCNIVIRLN